MIHQDFLRFIHVDDHEIVKKNLEPYPDDDEEQVQYELFDSSYDVLIIWPWGERLGVGN